MAEKKKQETPTDPQPTAARKLYRSSSDKVLGGVASGMGTYFGLDPVLVRVVFVIIGFSTFGLAILMYIGLWLIIPSEVGVNMSSKDSVKENFDEISKKADEMVKTFQTKAGTLDTTRSNAILGGLIVMLGIFLLFNQFGLLQAFGWIFNLWPLLLIALGFSLLMRK